VTIFCFSFDDFVIPWKTSQIGFNLVFKKWRHNNVWCCSPPTKIFSCLEAFWPEIHTKDVVIILCQMSICKRKRRFNKETIWSCKRKRKWPWSCLTRKSYVRSVYEKSNARLSYTENPVQDSLMGKSLVKIVFRGKYYKYQFYNLGCLCCMGKRNSHFFMVECFAYICTSVNPVHNAQVCYFNNVWLMFLVF